MRKNQFESMLGFRDECFDRFVMKLRVSQIYDSMIEHNLFDEITQLNVFQNVCICLDMEFQPV